MRVRKCEKRQVYILACLYIHEPNGYGVEFVYDLPHEVWEGDIGGALNYVKQGKQWCATAQQLVQHPIKHDCRTYRTPTCSGLRLKPNTAMPSTT